MGQSGGLRHKAMFSSGCLHADDDDYVDLRVYNVMSVATILCKI